MTLSRTQAWVVALAATLTMTVSYIDRQSLSVLAPEVTKALDISDAMYGWLSSAFSIAYLLATPLAGWWIDRVGARRGLVVSVLVWSGVAAMQALVPGFAMLFVLRILLGLAEGPSFPGSAQTVQRVLPPEDRSRGFGVLFSGSSIGGMIVPPLASFIFELHGWRVAFLVTSAVGLLWIPIWLLVTSRPAVRARIDNPPVVATARPRVIDLIRHPIMIRALIGIFAAAPVIGLMLAWGAKYLHATWGIPQKQVGGYLWLPPLMFDAGAILFGDLAARLRRPQDDSPARGLFALAMLLSTATVAWPFAESAWQGIVIVGIGVLGSGGLYSLCTADLMARMPASHVATAGGIVAGAQSIALIGLGPIIGAVVGHYGHYDGVGVGVGLWAIPGCLVWIFWKPPARY
jgi:ACS family hexuronate transporter-like MFS transporter